MLTLSDIRQLAKRYAIVPTKQLGQNFVHDAGTLRAIVAAANIDHTARVVEVGPGLGSLTIALLAAGAQVSAIEIDPRLAGALTATLHERIPERAEYAAVANLDALSVTGPEDLAIPPASSEQTFTPNVLVANLPYNVAVPILLTLLAALPTLQRVIVMVQAEVAERLVAAPGSRTYGVPSVKCQWYGRAKRIKTIGRNVFWPAPNVDSAVVELTCTAPPKGAEQVCQADVFACIDAAFSQRRKTLRAALGPWAGSNAKAAEILQRANIDPGLRGERLDITDFIAITAAKER